MRRRAAEKRAQKKKAFGGPPVAETGSPSRLNSSVSGYASDKKPRGGSPGSSSSSHRPRWSMVEMDSFGVPASVASKKLGRELCGAFILPRDRPMYHSTDSVEATANLLGHLSLAAPWVATLADKVKDQDFLLHSWEKQIRRIPALEREIRELKTRLASARIENADLKQENIALWHQNEKMASDGEGLLAFMEAKRAEFEEFRRAESPEPRGGNL